MPLRTPLCAVLGIDVPILSVGFGWGATPELVAAVSNAGGLGVLGLGIPPDAMRKRIEHTRALTSRPFGGNIILATLTSPHTTDEHKAARRAAIALAFELRIPVLVLFWGDPTPFVAPARAAGTKVLIQVGSPDEVEVAAAAGVDAIILQGIEAGGHVKATRSIWETLPEAVRVAGRIPVIASGGIGDGKGIARALRMGAQGVSLGTRFVASTEAWAHPHYKQRILGAKADDTVLTPDLYDIGWRDAPHRSLKNKTYAAWEAAGKPASGTRPGEGEVIGTQRAPWGEQQWLRYASGMMVPTFDGDPEDGVMWAGQSVDQIGDLRPAGDIVRELAAEAEEALA